MLYSEVDDEGWEVRKIEIFPDGRIGFASEGEVVGSTELGEKPLPSVEEISADPQFRATLVKKDDFEAVWARRFDRARYTA